MNRIKPVVAVRVDTPVQQKKPIFMGFLDFHDLRRECASRLYFDEGWTIYDVSRLLGHADVKTTERYIGADEKKRFHQLLAKRALTLVK